jgi:hypothetical protein
MLLLLQGREHAFNTQIGTRTGQMVTVVLLRAPRRCTVECAAVPHCLGLGTAAGRLYCLIGEMANAHGTCILKNASVHHDAFSQYRAAGVGETAVVKEGAIVLLEQICCFSKQGALHA